jgi:cytochrome c
VPQEPARKGADTEAGQLTFNNACRTCHTTKEGDNRLGPNLHNIIGRKAGSLPDYGYSTAMKGADFVWDEEKLDRFIASPDELVPGNSMKPYGGLASTDDRARIVSFLQSVTSGRPPRRLAALPARRSINSVYRPKRYWSSRPLQAAIVSLRTQTIRPAVSMGSPRSAPSRVSRACMSMWRDFRTRPARA